VILGAAVIDDILGLLALSLVKNVPSGTLDLDTLGPFVSVLVASTLFIIGGIVLGRRIVSRYFNEPAKDGAIGNAAFLGMLVYVLSYSYVAEYIGLSAIVGAFLAGVTLNYSKSVHNISGTFYPLEAFFTPIFFISLGMLVDIKALADNLLPILAITLIAVVTKAVGCGLATRFAGGSQKDSIVVGIGMIPRGEVALIIGLIGLTSTVQGGGTILTATEYSMIASMAFLTTLITPVMLQKAMEYGGYAVRSHRS
jgi:Kef-type K+ transport system membrane component KefB